MTELPTHTEPRKRWPRSRVVGLALAGVGLLAGLVCLVQVVSTAAGPLGGALTNESRRTPVEVVLTLEQGSYTVYERTGTQVESGGVDLRRTNPPTVSPDGIEVVGPSGETVEVGGPGFASETLTRNQATYLGIATFDVPTEGDYTVRVRAPAPTDVIIAPSLGSAFAGVGAWLLGGALSGLALLLGLVLVLWSYLAGRKPALAPAGASGPGPAVAPAPGPARVPPGWYPDPQALHQLRYWDGVSWTAHVTPRT